MPVSPTRANLLLALGLVLLAAGALAVRLPRLAARPMHGDEANQAVKTGLLLETGVYRYDPQEHHGPSLYQLTVPVLWLRGVPDLAHTDEGDFRIVPVLFGASLILLLWLVADGVGWPAALVAGLLTAISPAMVFYSRYYIQEPLLVWFTLAAIGAGWRYLRSGSLGWAATAGCAVGLLHATKETWVLAAAAMVAGVGLAILWSRCQTYGIKSLFSWHPGPPACGDVSSASPSRFRPAAVAVAVAVAVGAAVGVAALLYSSFGTYARGPLDSVLAYATYWRRGSGAESALHTHPWWFYLELLVAFRPARGFCWSEGLIVGLAAVGGIAALVRRGVAPEQRGFCRFLTFYTLTLTGLYAAIPYKTPWCLLSFLYGLILLAGVGAWALVRWLPGWPLKALVAAGLAAGVGQLGWQSYQLNSRFAADQRNPYVYAHSSRDVLNLASQLERIAQAAPEGHDMVIHVVTPENYWPLPWYLRQFNREHVGYWQDPAEWRKETDPYPPPAVIVLTADVQADIDAHLRGPYNRQMIYGLRPGVLLSVYVREGLWQAFLAAAERGQ